MRLLLDEMISPRVARELRAAGHDVQAIKGDRPDLASRDDSEIVRSMAAERRAIVTNDVADFQIIHDRSVARGEDHYGMVFTFDATLPRNRKALPRWTKALGKLLDAHRDEDALRNRVHQLL